MSAHRNRFGEYEDAPEPSAERWRCEECTERHVLRCAHRGGLLTDEEELALAREVEALLRVLDAKW